MRESEVAADSPLAGAGALASRGSGSTSWSSAIRQEDGTFVTNPAPAIACWNRRRC